MELDVQAKYLEMVEGKKILPHMTNDTSYLLWEQTMYTYICWIPNTPGLIH